MSHAFSRGTGRGRGSAESPWTTRLLRGSAVIVPIAAITIAVGAGCINSSVPLGPGCLTGIQIELSTEEIQIGDTFEATAVSQSDECLTNLMWSALGVISLDAAEASSATFHADDSGTGTIRVINDNGNLGVLEVTVEESEEGEAGRE